MQAQRSSWQTMDTVLASLIPASSGRYKLG